MYSKICLLCLYGKGLLLSLQCFVPLLFTFNVSFFLGIGPFLTGVKILLTVMNRELNDSCIVLYGINLDQHSSSLTSSRVVYPFCILFVAPLTLKSK